MIQSKRVQAARAPNDLVFLYICKLEQWSQHLGPLALSLIAPAPAKSGANRLEICKRGAQLSSTAIQERKHSPVELAC